MASTIYYQVGSGEPCVLGHKYDHNASIIHFNGFEMVSTLNTLYFKLKTNKNNYLIPLIDCEWNVTQPATLESGEFRGQLMEVSIDSQGVSKTIQSSETFKVVIQRSISDGYEITDPTLDLWMTKVKTLYDKYVSGGQYMDSIVAEVKAIQVQINTAASTVAADKAIVASDKAAVASDKASVNSKVSEFIGTTVPAAVQSVESKKTESLNAIVAKKTESIEAINSAKSTAISAVNDVKTESISAVNAQKTTSVNAVVSQEALSKSAVVAQQETSVSAVNAAKTNAVKAVNDEYVKDIALISTEMEKLEDYADEFEKEISSVKEDLNSQMKLDSNGYFYVEMEVN